MPRTGIQISRGKTGEGTESIVLSSDCASEVKNLFSELKSIEKDIEVSRLKEDAESRGIKLVETKKRKLKS